MIQICIRWNSVPTCRDDHQGNQSGYDRLRPTHNNLPGVARGGFFRCFAQTSRWTALLDLLLLSHSPEDVFLTWIAKFQPMASACN